MIKSPKWCLQIAISNSPKLKDHMGRRNKSIKSSRLRICKEKTFGIFYLRTDWSINQLDLSPPLCIMISGFVTPTTLSSLKMWCGHITSGKSKTRTNGLKVTTITDKMLFVLSFLSPVLLLSIHIRTSICCQRCDPFFGLSTSSETISCVCLKESSKKKKKKKWW